MHDDIRAGWVTFRGKNMPSMVILTKSIRFRGSEFGNPETVRRWFKPRIKPSNATALQILSSNWCNIWFIERIHQKVVKSGPVLAFERFLWAQGHTFVTFAAC